VKLLSEKLDKAVTRKLADRHHGLSIWNQKRKRHTRKGRAQKNKRSAKTEVRKGACFLFERGLKGWADKRKVP